MTPFFSVIIPLYNKEDYIEDTLKSVLNQSFKDFEIIIVNDGSTDNSLEIIKNFSDSRIKIIDQKNLGLSIARNNGVKNAKFNYIAFLDADDLWMEDYLQTITSLILINNSYEVFATSIKVLKPKKKAIFKLAVFNHKSIKIISSYFEISENIFSPSSLVINKNVFITVGGFNENVNYGEDEDFFIRCFILNSLVFYQEAKVYYRQGFKNQLTSPNPKFNRIIPNYDNYLNDENQFILKPYIDFIHYKLVILFKMERNYEMVKFYKQKIKPQNLTHIQQIKFYLPTNLFYFLKTCYLNFYIL